MAQNFIQDGVHLEYLNESGSTIESGSPVFAGKIIGIALGSIADDATGQIRTQGVFELTKKAALAVTAGDVLFWDADPGEITKTAADGVFIGYAAADAAGAADVVNVLLVGSHISATVAAISTADGSDAGTTQALANATKTTVNAILTALKNAGIMATA